MPVEEINKTSSEVGYPASVNRDTRFPQTPLEEFLNSFSHALGALFAIYAIVMMSVKSSTPLQSSTTAIYGSMLFVLFQTSAVYHAITNETAKNVFRRIDHSAIYLLIAGTYTPILMMVVSFPNNVALMAMVWYIAVTGIVFSCISLKFKHLSTALYLLMGWLSLFIFYPLWLKSHAALFYLLSGGFSFTFGSYFYLKEKRFMHCIWHLFVLAGAILHYFAVMTLLS